MFKRKGFTLIELLVVISIIALLLAILMPSLGKVKEMAKSLQCQSNLRQLTTSWFMYTTDNDNKLCGAYNYHPAMDWGHPYDWAWAPWQLNVDYPVPVTGSILDPDCTLAERHEGIKRGVMYPYSSNVNVYHCNSDKSERNNFRSYSIPDSMNGYYNKYKKYTQIDRPGEKYVFLEENDPRGYNINSWLMNTNPDVWGDPVTVWHGGKSSLGFADGHAETHKWSAETTEIFLDGYSWNIQPATEEGEEDLIWMQEGYGMER